MAIVFLRFTTAVFALAMVATAALAQTPLPPKTLSVVELAARVPEIKEGDDKYRVLEKLGQPDRTRPADAKRPEIWTYSNSNFTVVLEFENGRLKKKTTTTLVRGIEI